MKNYSFKFSDELATQVDAEAGRRNLTYSDVIRQAVTEHFDKGLRPLVLPSVAPPASSRKNFEAMMFEVVKNRALMLQCFDMIGKCLPDRMVEQAEKDATEYMEQKRDKEAA